MSKSFPNALTSHCKQPPPSATNQFAGIRYVEGNEMNDMAYHSTVPRIFEAVPLGKFCTEHYWDYSQEGDPQMDAICKEYLKHPRLLPISNFPEKLGYEAGDAIVSAIKGE